MPAACARSASSCGGWGREGSAQRGTSEATTGPRGARSAPPNPDLVTFECLVGGPAYSPPGYYPDPPIGGSNLPVFVLFLTSCLPNLLLTVLAALL